MYTLIVTAKLNDVDPQAWLADVLARIPKRPCRGSTNCCLGNGQSSSESTISPHSGLLIHPKPVAFAEGLHFGGRYVRVRGAVKVCCPVTFGLAAMAADSLLRLRSHRMQPA
jgi:hypothetical protein